jgi:hypothetical protein
LPEIPTKYGKRRRVITSSWGANYLDPALVVVLATAGRANAAQFGAALMLTLALIIGA